MSDNNKYIEQDNLFRSILEEGQEQVPAHVWNGIEADLNRIASRKRRVIWFGRSAAGVAAAAALAIGLFFGSGSKEDFITPASDENMIAVVTPQQTETAVSSEETDINVSRTAPTATGRYIAMAEKTVVKQEKEFISTDSGQEDLSIDAETGTDISETKAGDNKETAPAPAPEDRTLENQQERFPDIWPEDDIEKERKRPSITISGLTSTNSAQNNNRVAPLRRPASPGQKKAGIKETNAESIYGIPVSVGAGVRFDISKRWSIGTGLNYTLLTRKFQGTYIDAEGVEYKPSPTDIRESQHYIGIPVNFYYEIVNQKNVNFYTYLGGAAEKCVYDKFNILNSSITHTEKVTGIQLSANIGLGVEFMLGRHLGLYLDPSLRYYFNCSQPKSIRTVQPLMFGLEMGFRINL